jgi:hypothetical protein
LNGYERRGLLSERSVAFWTVVGGALAVPALIIGIISMGGDADKKGDSPQDGSTMSAPTHSSPPSQAVSIEPTIVPNEQSLTVQPVQPTSVTFLSDLSPVGGARMGGGTDVTINGTDYPHSVLIYCLGSDVTGRQQNDVEYNIGLKGRRFTGLVGIGDTEDARGLPANVTFYRDTKVAKTVRVLLGHPQKVSFDLEGVLRLRIDVRLIQSVYDGRSINVSVGNAHFTS